MDLDLPAKATRFMSRVYSSFIGGEVSLVGGLHSSDCDPEIPGNCEPDPNPSPLIMPITMNQDREISLSGGIVASQPGKVYFDIEGDGYYERPAWVAGNTGAFLCLKNNPPRKPHSARFAVHAMDRLAVRSFGRLLDRFG